MDSSIWHGKLNLTYEYEEGKTRLSSGYHEAPFKIQKPFYPIKNNSLCQTIILHTAGGIVGGDYLLQEINLKNNCQTLITTATAGKIYKTNGKTAVQNIIINLNHNAHLDYFPQDNIIFNGAEYSQKSSIYLSENTSYCQWEINRFGRTARNEKFTYDSWKSITEIFLKDQLIWCDRTYILGNETMINSPNGLAGFAISGTFAGLGRKW